VPPCLTRTLRNRFFRGRHNQLTVAAIQHEDVAGFSRSVNAPAKTGNIFVLDRSNGKLVVPAPEKPVPQGAAKGRYGFTVNGNVRQRRLGRHIHIPQIVVNGLVAPRQGLPADGRIHAGYLGR
jgi:hypothetical protein